MIKSSIKLGTLHERAHDKIRDRAVGCAELVKVEAMEDVHLGLVRVHGHSIELEGGDLALPHLR